ncbi:MAG: hypothetical protein MI922_03070 [Bacteroidales bacterium]|nr:hypothetical protein [Bacteroidales bacterium]
MKIQEFNTISWNFNINSFDDQEELYDELMAYNLELVNDDKDKLDELIRWNPFRLVILFSQVKIATKNDEDEDDWVYLSADNGENFTSLELLLKVNNLYIEVFQETQDVFLQSMEILETSEIPELVINCIS